MTADNDIEQELLENVKEKNDTKDHDHQFGMAASRRRDTKKDAKDNCSMSIRSLGFRDFLLKPQLLRGIIECGFEHPSEGQLVIHSFIYLIIFHYAVD